MAVALVLATAAARAESLSVVIPQKGFWDSLFVEFGQQQGFFDATGLHLTLTYTSGGAESQQAVVSGSADIAINTGFLSAIAAYVKGAPVRVIAAEITGTNEAYWYARANSGIKSLKDATGKTVAYSVAGSTTNLILLGLLAQAGVKARPVATGGVPATLTQVMSGQIDIGYALPPIGLKEVADGKLVIVARGNDLPEVKQETIRVIVANLTSLQSKRDAITRFIQALMRSIDWAYNDPSAIDEFAKEAGVSRAIAEKTRDEFFPQSAFKPDDIRGVDLVLQDAYKYKYIPKPMTPDQVKGMFDIVYHP